MKFQYNTQKHDKPTKQCAMINPQNWVEMKDGEVITFKRHSNEEFSPKGKFDPEDQLDLYECPVAGHQCVYVRCIDKIGKKKDEIVPNIVDCQKPEMVNCTKFTSECESQDGRACCYICNTDGCNKSWKNSTFSSTIPTSTSTTTNKFSSTPPAEIKNKLQCLAWNICNLSTKLKQSKVSRRFAIG
ncbi:hypothetical protein niasHT_036931 [Heterodera trifolii]|uniref:Uncharacterized protein n=1 Tax=Heterodera trifolii TaxID=157864 RepID=A0ABD2IXK0_9BILA